MIKGRFRSLSYILQFMNCEDSRLTFKDEQVRIRKLYIMVATVFFMMLVSRYWVPLVVDPVPSMLDVASRTLQIILYGGLLITILF
jgi:hypothetical protein